MFCQNICLYFVQNCDRNPANVTSDCLKIADTDDSFHRSEINDLKPPKKKKKRLHHNFRSADVSEHTRYYEPVTWLVIHNREFHMLQHGVLYLFNPPRVSINSFGGCGSWLTLPRVPSESPDRFKNCAASAAPTLPMFPGSTCTEQKPATKQTVNKSFYINDRHVNEHEEAKTQNKPDGKTGHFIDKS